ncbi:geranylgeranylglyceryl/heptaprenylglyceryl phosphate synthase [Salimicrobium jeotgali]|uniref:Geranylgeranylglyceryl phosphate synthase-like protein n=1 Tax=Salimicrobium jeotgali TaxID=1230341 RepID=K2H9V7_9BACI|nr:heptaprenylglyceryl phosphate synthase [Salimicrobium jeotgali]AKG05195.1 geranylgeranylglyceryl/heptaprenylglyceryl phosphate synthase [Salimicrobium jeotgali]EKE32425.1 geranylgeranylglyceryl phosphate synthase-like protein [Salimicrobium jeotgali]MBM7695596.1 putative glycerol-1-phosphate prenyltransferase [Salimicrobium jeotgali]
MKNWKHAFKLDPNKDITEEEIRRVCESGTDAVIVGGTDGVTFDNVWNLFEQIEPYDVPLVLEISDMEAVVPGFDYYFVPAVLNSKDKTWVLDMQHQAMKLYGDMVEEQLIFSEGYCIVNEEAKAFRKTNCFPVTEEDILAYARLVEQLFPLPIFYLEYSGKKGDTSLIQKVSEELSRTQFFYGGGIQSREEAEEIQGMVDTMIVGNIIYEDFETALQTVPE